jgi:hypothetical protein
MMVVLYICKYKKINNKQQVVCRGSGIYWYFYVFLCVSVSSYVLVYVT